MGILQEVADHPLGQQFQAFGLAAQVAIVLGGVIGLSIVVHIAKQLLFKSPNEPPMVFSWFPVIGNTITYGMDPPAFFKKYQAKVSTLNIPKRSRSAY